MAKRDPERTEKLRIAVRYLLRHGDMALGSQSRLAEHFKVSRQRVHQIVVEERRQLPAEEGHTTTRHESRAS
jgi:DNA-directed RNA polymerase sigma subunit (sigma70/sigma32)